MELRFRGKSTHKVDAKGRVSIPASFRRALVDGDPDCKDGDNPQLIVVFNKKDGKCHEGHSIRSMNRLDEMISEMEYDDEREFLEDALATNSDYMTVDDNGRMILTPELRDAVGIKKEVVFAGKGDTFQIWAPDAYEVESARIKSWGNAQKNPYAGLRRVKTKE